MVRRGASLIELIIAIVVMGFAVASVSLTIMLVNSNNEFSLRQELILEAEKRFKNVFSFDWDKNSYDLNTSKAYVLDTNSTIAKSGLTGLSGRRELSSLAASPIGGTDGIEKFNNMDTNVGISSINNGLGDAKELDFIYDKYITIKHKVDYIHDNANYSDKVVKFNFPNENTNHSNPSTNIKRIKITVTGFDNDENITLYGYALNIGESKPLNAKVWQ